jgi:hypothetical protein
MVNTSIYQLQKLKALKIASKIKMCANKDENDFEDNFEDDFEEKDLFKLSNIVEIKAKLSKLGYHLKNELGAGTFGVAYTLEGGRVLKITSDSDEASTSATLIDHDLEHVVNIFRVFTLNSQPKLFFIEEEKLQPLSNSEVQDMEDIFAGSIWHTDHIKYYLQLNHKHRDELRKVLERDFPFLPSAKLQPIMCGFLLSHKGRQLGTNPIFKHEWLHVQELLLGLQELSNADILFADAGPNNIAKTSSGVFKWIDLGFGSKSAHKGLIEKLNSNVIAESTKEQLSEALDAWTEGDPEYVNVVKWGLIIEGLLKHLPKDLRRPLTNTLYRFVKISTSLLLKVLKEQKEAILQNRKYSSWTTDIQTAKNLGELNSVEPDPEHSAIILKRAFSPNEILLDVNKAFDFVGGQPPYENENEIIIRNMSKDLKLTAKDIYLYYSRKKDRWFKL